MIEFKNIKNSARSPFIIYADFESLLVKPDTATAEKHPRAYQIHKPCSVGVKLVCIRPEHSLPYKTFFGDDVVKQFLKWLIKAQYYVMRILKTPVPLTSDEVELAGMRMAMKIATECHICRKEFKEGEMKVCKLYFLLGWT